MSADPIAAGGLEEWTLAGLHDALAASLPLLPREAAVLDLGCGTGAWLARLRRLGFRDLCGVDKRADINVAGVIHFQRDLGEKDWGLASRKFSLISAIEVLEHLENPGFFFERVATHLRPGGYFLFTTPNIQSLNSRLKFLLTGRLPQFDEKSEPTHVSPVLLAALRRVLPRHGLRIERVWGYPQRGSLTSRALTRLASVLLSPFLREDVPGDVMCVLARAAD
jgi:SAM-dependent methyltransferase